MLAAYQRLAELRRSLPSPDRPVVRARSPAPPTRERRVFTMRRSDLLMVVNFGDDDAELLVDGDLDLLFRTPSRPTLADGRLRPAPARRGAARSGAGTMGGVTRARARRGPALMRSWRLAAHRWPRLPAVPARQAAPEPPSPRRPRVPRHRPVARHTPQDPAEPAPERPPGRRRDPTRPGSASGCCPRRPTASARSGRHRPSWIRRRFTLPDRLPPLPGTGFASRVTTPAPASVIARSTWKPGCPVAAGRPVLGPARLRGLRRPPAHRASCW